MSARLVATIQGSLKHRGMAQTLRLCVKNLGYHARRAISRWRGTADRSEFDERFGVDTSGIMGRTELGIEGKSYKYAVGYHPIEVKPFTDSINSLEINFEDFSFVDFGSGKGRALLLASNFPFKRIVGVEISAELHRIAEENIRKYLPFAQKCKDIRSVCMDATIYPMTEEPTVFYFYNPFEEPIMRTVLANIRKSLEAKPRRIFIVYCNPVLSDLFKKMEFLKLLFSDRRFCVYTAMIEGRQRSL